MDAEAKGGDPGRDGRARRGRGQPGPWEPSLVEPRPRSGRAGAATGEPGEDDAAAEKGGASDVHRPQRSGASDLYRR
jgi:hypothetical protein